MKIKVLFHELLTLAKKSGIKVRRDILIKSKGGACILNQEKIIILNKTFPIEKQASFLARYIAEINPPELNEIKNTEIYQYILNEYSNEKSTSIEFIV